MTSSAPLQIRGLPSGMFGDIVERRVVLALESSARLALAMPTVRKHVADALLRLAHRQGYTAFSLVVGSKPSVWAKDDQLTPATSDTVSQVVAWLAEQPCRSTADHLGSLLAALRPDDCQAVYLVAATAPTDRAEAESVLDHVAYLARGRPVHCTCLQLPGDRDGHEADRLLEFLHRLAAETCGSLTSVRLDESQSVASVERHRGGEGPAERLIRTKDGRLRPELATCSITTCLPTGVDPLLEPPLLPPPAGLRSFSRYRPARAFISAGNCGAGGAAFRPAGHPFCPAGGATLIGRRVLARRQDRNGGYYRGKVVSEVEPDLFLVEFPPDAADSDLPTAKQPLQHQETRIGDIVSLDDALRHPIAPGDAVLLASPAGTGGRFEPGLVLRGHESRGSAAAGDDETPLTVAMAAGDGLERQASAGDAVWIPRRLYDWLLIDKNCGESAAAAAEAGELTGSDALGEKSPTIILCPPGLMYVYPTAALVAPLMLNSGTGRDFPILSSHLAPLYYRPMPATVLKPMVPELQPAAETGSSATMATESAKEETKQEDAAPAADATAAASAAARDEAELLALDRELAATFGTCEIGVGDGDVSIESANRRRSTANQRRRQNQRRPPWRYWGAGGVGCGVNSTSGMPDVVELYPADPHINWGRCDVLERRLNPADQARPRLRPDSPHRLLDPRLFDRFGDPTDHRMTREQATADAMLPPCRQWRRTRSGDVLEAEALFAARSRQLDDAQVKHELHRLDRQQRSEAAEASLKSALRAQLQREAQQEAQAYRQAVQDELRCSRNGDYQFRQLDRSQREVPAIAPDPDRYWRPSAAPAVTQDFRQPRLVESATAQRTVAEWLRYQDLMDARQAASSAQTLAGRHRDCHSALLSHRQLRRGAV